MKKIILVIFMSPIAVYSSEKPMETYARVMRAYATGYSFFNATNLPDDVARTLNEGLRRGLLAHPDIIHAGDCPFSERSFSEKKTFDYFRHINCGSRIIVGFARYAAYIQRTPVNTHGEGRYLIKKTRTEKIYFEIYLLDIDNTRILLSLKDECNFSNNEIDLLLDTYANRIAQYYPHVDRPIEKHYPAYVRLGGVLTLPKGAYYSISPWGGGITVGMHVENLLIDSSFLTVELDLSAGYSTNWQVDSYVFSPLTVGGGYILSPFSSLRCVPSIGGGYIVHIMNMTMDGSYHDPLLYVSGEIQYRYEKMKYLFLKTAYDVFFEHSTVGRFWDISFGWATEVW